jgi:elongation factor Ts
MSQISAALVKQLREQTGAGMMDCKKALTETGADIEQAIDWLRKKGLSAAVKKSARVASEGLIALAIKNNSGALVEVNAETDFVARNTEFQEFALLTAKVALTSGAKVEKLSVALYPDTEHSVAEQLIDMVGRIGENMVLRRSSVLGVDHGVVAGYLHNAVTPSTGKIGVLVGLESAGDGEALKEFGHKLAMHICAARPVSVDKKSIDPVLIEREKTVLREQAQAAGKSTDIVEKMVDGRLRKFYQEVILEEQIYVIDGESIVKKIIEDFEEKLGTPVRVSGFIRFELGEGVEKKDDDFAAEVAAQIKT